MGNVAVLEGLKKVEERIQGRDRVLTIGDTASIAGTSVNDAKDILTRLLALYDCSLKITENGDLIYDFGQNLHKRGERTWEEWWFSIKQMLWNVFVFVFKIWIAVTLVVYFVIFVVILIAMIIATLSGNSDGDSGGGSSGGDSDGGFFSVFGELFRGIFIWNNNTSTHYNYDNDGHRYREYDRKNSPLNKKSKDFVASVYDFVFGPPRVSMTRQDQHREVAQYLRENKGIITKNEIIGLSGLRSGDAENFFSESIAKYQGDAEISDNKVLYGDFRDFIRSKGAGGKEKIIWYWDEFEAPHYLTGNTFWRNFWIIFMNLFNLCFATAFLSMSMQQDMGAGIAIGLGAVPFVFSLLFFLVPILRYFPISALSKKRDLENMRKRLMKAIFMSEEGKITDNEFLKLVNPRESGEKNISADTVNYMMQELIKDLDGEIETNSNGKLLYNFVNFQEEKREAVILRQKRDDGRALGEVVFDSHD